MIGIYRVNWTIITLGIFMLTGCSVADYKNPITELKAAIDISVTTVENIDQEITKAKNAALRSDVSNNKAFLLTPDDTCAKGKTSCSLIVRYLGPNTKPIDYPVTSMMPSAHVGLSGLKSYVANLKAIVDADTASKVSTSASEAIASATKIKASVEKGLKALDPNAPALANIEKYNEPILSTVKWMVSQYIDRIKYNALAAATKRAQPIIVSLNDYHGLTSESATELKSGKALSSYNKAQQAYDSAPKKVDSVINALDKASSVYNSALRGTAAQPLKAFLDAHTKLEGNLNGDVSLSDAIAAIKTLKKRADEFKKIIKDFNDIASKEGGQ